MLETKFYEMSKFFAQFKVWKNVGKIDEKNLVRIFCYNFFSVNVRLEDVRAWMTRPHVVLRHEDAFSRWYWISIVGRTISFEREYLVSKKERETACRENRRSRLQSPQ